MRRPHSLAFTPLLALCLTGCMGELHTPRPDANVDAPSQLGAYGVPPDSSPTDAGPLVATDANDDARNDAASDDDAGTHVVEAAFASPTGSGIACTREAPCDWRTATRSPTYMTTVLLDGRYTVGAGDVWCVREGRTVVADTRYAATVVFEGNTESTGDDQGSCSSESGFGFGVYGTLDGVEIIAPARWSAVDVHPPEGVRATLRNLWVHDVNVETQTYYGYGNCAQQGAIDLDHGTMENSLIYRVGQRTGIDPTRGSSNLTTCINYHALYAGAEAQVTNNLFVDAYGGWCVHAYHLTDVDSHVQRNTFSGCHQGAVIFPFVGGNTVTHNVMVNGRTDTVPGWPSPSVSPYGTCIIVYENATYEPSNVEGNVCRNNPNNTVNLRASGSFDGSVFDTTADVTPALVPTSSVLASLDAATSPSARRDALRALSVDPAASHGAGFVAP